MGLFARAPGSLLGIDIGTAAIKLVQLDGREAPRRLAAWAVEPVPPNAVSGDQFSDIDAVGEAIARAVKRAKCRGRRAAVAVPAAAVANRQIAVDAALGDREIEVEVALDAQAQLAHGDELAVDFEVLQLSAEHPAKVDVAVTACRRETVAQREAALRRAGLHAAVVDVDSHCLLRVVAMQSAPGETVAVAEIGANAVKLLTTRDGATLFAHSEPVPTGLASRDELGREVLLDQLARLLRTSTATAGAVRIVLAGGGAATPGLATEAAARLPLPLTVLQPFAGMALGPEADSAELAAAAPALATACGLALREPPAPGGRGAA